MDIGIKQYDIIEELANSNKYEGTGLTAFNPTLYSISDKSISFLRLSYSSQSLESTVNNSNFTAELSDIAMSYTHLLRIKDEEKFSIYLGGNINTHLKFYEQGLANINEVQVFEHSLVALKLSSMFKMKTSNWDLFFQPEIGLLNHWTKAIPLGSSISDYKYQTDWFNLNDFQITIFGIYKLSERWEFKPEYSLSHYNYRYMESHVSQVLNQRWIIGFYYLL